MATHIPIATKIAHLCTGGDVVRVYPLGDGHPLPLSMFLLLLTDGGGQQAVVGPYYHNEKQAVVMVWQADGFQVNVCGVSPLNYGGTE